MLTETTEDLQETQIDRLGRLAYQANFGCSMKDTLSSCYTGDTLAALHVTSKPQAMFFDLHSGGTQLLRELAPDKCTTCSNLLLSTKDPAVRNMLQWPETKDSTELPTVHSINRTIIEMCPGSAYCPVCVVLTGDVFAVKGFPQLATFLMSTETTKRALLRPIESDALSHLVNLIAQGKITTVGEVLAKCRHTVCPMTMMTDLTKNLQVHECPIPLTDMFLAHKDHQHPSVWETLAKKHVRKHDKRPKEDDHNGTTDHRASTLTKNNRDSKHEDKSHSHDTDSGGGKGKGGKARPRDTDNFNSTGKGAKSGNHQYDREFDPYYTNSGYGSSRRTAEDKGGGRGKGYHHQAYKGNDASAARQQTQPHEGQSRSGNGGRKRGSDQQDANNYSALTQLQGNSKDRRLNGRDPN